MGEYVISARVPVVVAPGKELTPPPFVADLKTGDVVEVLQIELLEQEQRVRGRLKDPPGWISLYNPSSGDSACEIVHVLHVNIVARGGDSRFRMGWRSMLVKVCRV